MSADRPLVGAVTRAVQRADTVPALRADVCDAVVDAGYDFACVCTTDGESVTASQPSVEPPEPEAVTPTFRSAASGPTPTGSDNAHGAPQRLDDDVAAPAVDERAVTWVPYDDAHAAAVPVADDDDHYGTLSFGPDERADTDAEREQLAVVGSVVAQAITRLDAVRQRDQLRDSLRTERRQFEKLHSIAAAMVGCDDATSIYHLAIDAAENILEFDICGIDVVEDGYLVPKATSTGLESGDSQRLPADAGIAGRTYQENSTMVVDDVTAHEDAEPANPEYVSVLSVPIDDVGVFQAGSRERGAFSRADAELVELLMAHVSATLRRLRSADALRESERKYRTLVEQSHDAVVTYADGELSFANERASALFGRSHEELLAVDADELFHPEDRVKLERVVAELTASPGRHQTFESRIQQPDGDVRFCEFSATSIDYEDDVAVLASIRDITERKARERDLERQNERLDEFASVVSHDLRSPINVARGSLDLATDTGDDAHLDRAADALDRMEALVEDVLELARHGRLVDETEPVELADVATDAWGCVDTADATMTVDTDLVVAADPSRLQELFENLFRNAVEHGSTGPDSHAHRDAVEHGSTDEANSTENAVEVTVTSCEDGFAVVDDGPGLPDGSHDDVFERGFTSTDDGTGFGLAIVESIADAHGWTIDAVPPGDDAERGARFEVTDCDSE
ncbi:MULTISPECIES: PAS domain S-box protein [Halobacterium]|uniref:PAS domain S-box protein n=1 Tax=Halobacterium TaxID=2239 RepID=UPI00073E1FC4|nr:MULTISPECIES: PAS domain S-box protein [Halobacterium]MCG1002683.1 PAS domain S-box protein [Halobacterium noricense]